MSFIKFSKVGVKIVLDPEKNSFERPLTALKTGNFTKLSLGYV